MASKFPIVGGAPPSLGGVQGKGLHHTTRKDKQQANQSTSSISKHLIHDIANRLDCIQLATNPNQRDIPYPITVDSPSWLTTPSTSVNIRCSCGNIDRQPSHHGNYTVDRIIHSSDSDEESDEESFSLEDLLRILCARDRDGNEMQGKQEGGTLNNLVKSYSCRIDDKLSESALAQLLNLIDSNVSTVQEAALLTLAQVCHGKANAERLLLCQTVKRLLVFLDKSNQPRTLVSVALALEQLTTHQELKDKWLELMITDGLPIIMGHLHGHPNDNSTVIAMANILGQLAKYFELAILILDHCMYHIMAAWKLYSALKAPILRLLEQLVTHNEHTMSAALDHGILHYANIILKDSDCCSQVSAIQLYLQLCQSPYGLSALLEEKKLPLVLRVTMATHCREVRKLGVLTLEKTMQQGTPSQVKDLLLQLADYLEHDSTTDKPSESTDGVLHIERFLSSEKEPVVGSKRKHTQDRVERGARYTCRLLVHCIHKEGKMSLDSNGCVQSVGFKPNVDQYMCLSYAVSCVFYMATLPVHRQRIRTSSNISPTIRNKKRLSNSVTTQYVIESGALCLSDILHKYTTYLTSQGVLPTVSHQGPSTQQRNVDVLYLKTTMKLWQQQSESLMTHKKMCDTLSDGEIQFLRQLMQAVQVIAKCSTVIRNQWIEDEIREDISRYQAWEGAGDAGHSAPYQYVKTIDHAFYTSHADRPKMNSGSNSMTAAWGSNYEHDDQRVNPSKNESHDYSEISTTEISWENVEEMQLGHHGNIVTSRNEELLTHRKMQMQLFKTGVSSYVGSLLLSGDTKIQVSAIDILRCLVQPFDQSEVTKMQRTSVDTGGLLKKPSKASLAESLNERDRILSMVLEEMSSSTASVVKDALNLGGHQTKSHPKSVPHSKSSIRPSSAKYPESKCHPISGNRPSSAKYATNKHSTSQHFDGHAAPQLSSKEPIYWQNTMYVLETCGQHLIHMVRCEDVEVARATMLLLYDMVKFGEVIVQMKLTSLGFLTVLMDIISLHINDKVMPLLSLMTLQQMVFSDYRMKQLFMAEGGKEFLDMNAQISHGAIRARIDLFLNLITRSGQELY